MKKKDLINLLNRATAVIEDPGSEIRSHREDLIDQLVRTAQELTEEGDIDDHP
jgi:hypothetical protein